jgi:uncharacterized protein (DUF1501 family)
MRVTRRDLLKASVAGAAFGIVGLRRKSGHAGGPPRAKRVLLFNAGGGIRNTAAFNATSRVDYNPWGVLGTRGSLKLGNVLLSENDQMLYAAPSWPGAPTVPAIDAVASKLAMIGAVNHAMKGPRAGDHTDESERMGTGYFGLGKPGLLTVISRALAPSKPALPVAMIGGAGGFGAAKGEWLPYAPVGIVPYGLPQGGNLAPSRTFGVEDALDASARSRRNGLSASLVDQYLGSKAAMRTYGPMLVKPELHVVSASNLDATVGGITNRMLLEAVGNAVGTGTGDMEGVGVALALRMLQMGSPAIGVGVGGFDLHSEEKEKGPLLYTRYARMLAGVHFALSRMPDPSGTGTMLDTTLVVTVSEFDRCAEPPDGFNAADGSGHAGGSDPNPHQPHVVFGAGVTPKLIAPTDNDNQAKDQRSTHALLATICGAVGVPGDVIDQAWPAGTALYPDGHPIEELWA